MLTIQEVSQYIRLTLKQYKVSVKVSFCDKVFKEKGFSGYYNIAKKEIVLDNAVLKSFAVFKYVFLHELCHKLDHQERGTLFKNGRANFHGANFNKWCKTLGIPKGALMPPNLSRTFLS
jgi:predicted SprT family Zn-dependent metalloprotease